MTDAPILDPAALGRLRRIGGDNLVSRMSGAFFTHGAERVAAIRAALATGDARGIEHAAHSLKSSAGNLGGVRLQYTAETLEHAAADGRIEAETAEQLFLIFDETADALRRTLGETVR